MNNGFRLFPESASDFAHRVDALFLFLLAVAAVFATGICVTIVAFAVRYRRGKAVERRQSKAGRMWILEATWIVIPLLLTMVMFTWGASLYVEQRQPPANATELTVVGKQWMWKIQHAGGRREINALHVPRGEAIKLRMISEDVIHSFYLPAFRVKMDVLPGRYTYLWFKATKSGEYPLFCAEYCGTSHSAMHGRLVVMEPAEYAAWLAGESAEPPAVAGRRLFERYRCQTCHEGTSEAARRCPPLVGLFGRDVALADGRTAVADESYLRESILNPAAKVVQGYSPQMPAFQGQIGEEEVLQIIAYLKSLTAPPNSAAKEPATENADDETTDQGSGGDRTSTP